VLRLGGYSRVSSAYPLLMLTKCVQSTRLVTRTKEFSICASVWARKTHTRNESEGWFGQLRWEGAVTNGVRTIDLYYTLTMSYGSCCAG